MPYKNVKDLLVNATKFPAAIEAKLPAGAPVISTMLLDAANTFPVLPDFPMEIPDLPAPPELPAMPAPPGGAGLARVFQGPKIEVIPVGAPAPAVAKSKRYLF